MKMKIRIWDIAKAVFKGNFIKVNSCIRKEGKSKINDLRFQFKKLEKKGKLNTKQEEKKGYNKDQSGNQCNRKEKSNRENK